MTKRFPIALAFSALSFFCIDLQAGDSPRQLTYADYLDKVRGGWMGKAIGLVLGVPKEFSEPWPPSEIREITDPPDHFSDLHSGDDLYFPLLFQTALRKYGPRVTPEQYMKEAAARLYSGRVWSSVSIAMDHHWAGIAPPLTGAPGFNRHYDDLGAQISLDVFGWVAPGMVNTAAQMADPAAHLINWGDAADGGLFIAALSSEAFFNPDREQLIRRAAAVLPEGSRYGKMVADTLRVSREQRDWRMARQILAALYSPEGDPGDVTAVTNGIPILLGLLYGRGDFGQSLLIALKCRWDSDCSAASVGGVMGVLLGASRIPPSWSHFLHDTYENQCLRGLPRWMTFTQIARESIEVGSIVVTGQGGVVSGKGDNRVFSIPVQEPRRIVRKEAVTPELAERNERAMRQHYQARLKGITDSWDPRWTLAMASFETRPEVLPDYFGRSKVLRVQPGSYDAVLERMVTLEAGKHHYLRLEVAHHPRTLCDATGQLEFGDWRLEVRVDGKPVGEYSVNSADGRVLWENPQFDLTPWAGKSIKLSLVAHEGRPMFYKASSTSYWSRAEILSLEQPEPWRDPVQRR